MSKKRAQNHPQEPSTISFPPPPRRQTLLIKSQGAVKVSRFLASLPSSSYPRRLEIDVVEHSSGSVEVKVYLEELA